MCQRLQLRWERCGLQVDASPAAAGTTLQPGVEPGRALFARPAEHWHRHGATWGQVQGLLLRGCARCGLVDLWQIATHDVRVGVNESERVHPQTRSEWRKWLESNHESSTGVWLVSWRKHTGKDGPSYEDTVEEALCYGWVDSRGGKLDDDRTMLWFSPRKPGSGWARPNKERVERLTAAGLMRPAGQRVVDTAKADGSWSRLDDVENLVIPDDLAAAFDSRSPARRNWNAFPRSVRRSILEWIVQAKREPTRAARVEETARLAQVNERANQRRPKNR